MRFPILLYVQRFLFYLCQGGVLEAANDHAEPSPAPLVGGLDQLHDALASLAQPLAGLVAHLGHLLLSKGGVGRSTTAAIDAAAAGTIVVGGVVVERLLEEQACCTLVALVLFGRTRPILAVLARLGLGCRRLRLALSPLKK